MKNCKNLITHEIYIHKILKIIIANEFSDKNNVYTPRQILMTAEN